MRRLTPLSRFRRAVGQKRPLQETGGIPSLRVCRFQGLTLRSVLAALRISSSGIEYLIPYLTGFPGSCTSCPQACQLYTNMSSNTICGKQTLITQPMTPIMVNLSSLSRSCSSRGSRVEQVIFSCTAAPRASRSLLWPFPTCKLVSYSAGMTTVLLTDKGTGTVSKR